MTARLALAVSLIALVLAGLCVRHEGASVLRVERHATPTPTLPSVASGCVNGVVPCGQIFGLSGIQYVVLSQYAYEASILPFGDPVGDFDYLLGYGVQEMVRLPGGAWNHFRYDAAVCVPGSGWVARFIHLHNGRPAGDFDYLHLQYVTVGGRTPDCQPSPSAAPPVFNEGDGLSGDEHTAQVAAQLFAHLRPAASGTVLHGGQIVGRSMWPTSTIYGNGSCCQQDSHLCVLLSAKALGYFWTVATGRDKPPTPPFPWRKWTTYTRTHHRKAVPAYHKGKLRPEAQFWVTHAALLGYVTHEETWHAVKGGHGYERMPFTRRALLYWPYDHAFKIAPLR